ncbi:MAG: MBL fold metallo-hydrolase [Lentihominibacter sp.]
MTVKFCSLASGSSGNCYLVKDNKTAILIDAGISGTRQNF